MSARDQGSSPRLNPSGTANPNAHRRRSRRSNDRQDKPIHARRGPSAKPKPRRHSQPQERPGGKADAATPIRTDAPTRDKGPQRTQPDGQLRPRKTTAQTTRTRQRRAAQAAQTAVGVAQLRILLRDDHAESFRQRKVTSHPTPAKSAFLWGYPRFFWQDKRNGVQRA